MEFLFLERMTDILVFVALLAAMDTVPVLRVRLLE